MSGRLAKVPLFGNVAKAVTVNRDATVGAQIGVDLLMPDGTLATTAKLQAMFGSTPSTGTSIDTTDDVDEGAYHLYFTAERAQDAVGGILSDSATVSLDYVSGTSITATLNDLTDSGAGTLLALTFDAKGRKTGSRAATITGTAGRVTVANGDASAGLPTIDLATVADAGGGALLRFVRDAWGRVIGTSAATTTDLAEGTNLYFTEARADARITAAKADPNGVASLVGGKLDAGQLPALAITETFVVNTQAAMLALSAQEGDVAVRTDLSKSFILTAAPASTLANWQELLTPASPVTSIFGRVGSVTAATGDYTFAQIGSTPTTLAGYGIADAEPTITAGTTAQYWRGDKSWQTLNKAAVGLGNADNTSDVNKPVSTAQQTALDGKANLSGGNTFSSAQTFSGAVGIGAPASAFQFEVYGATAGLGLSRTTGEAFVQLSDSLTGTVGGQMRAVITGPGLKFTRRDGGGLIWWTMPGLIPGADNTYDVGSASLRGRVAYFATGTINTSDAREKTDVAPLTADELAAAADLARAIGTYQWLASVAEKGADNARHHAGLTVQRAIAIMQSHSLDPFAYGFICYDQWDELQEQWADVPEERDDEDNVTREASREMVQEYRPAGDRYSFRTDELLLFVVRGFAARLDALETKA